MITPVLNGVGYVTNYIESLRRQTFENWEAIVIDDGSTDGSAELLQRLTAGDPRFSVVQNTRPRVVAGPYQARNVGLEQARGEFVCFLDIDDYWLQHKLAAQNAELEGKPKIKLLYASYIRARRGSSTGKIRSTDCLLSPHQWIKFANQVPMLTSCVHRGTIDGLYFKPHHHEDYLFWHEVIEKLQPGEVANNREPSAIYSVHSESLSSNKLRATRWIWQCYRILGYSRRRAAAALLLRGIFQAWLMARETTSPLVRLEEAERCETSPKRNL